MDDKWALVVSFLSKLRIINSGKYKRTFPTRNDFIDGEFDAGPTLLRKCNRHRSANAQESAGHEKTLVFKIHANHLC